MSNFFSGKMSIYLPLLKFYERVMLLKIYIDSDDDELNQKYIQSVTSHNNKIINNPNHIDAGFDIFVPTNININHLAVNKVDSLISCSAKMYTNNDLCYNTGYYTYPRSSISKSNIRLANNVGIIDAGYRGHLIGMFDCIYFNPEQKQVVLNKFDRYLQICAPTLCPIIVQIVDTKEDLGEETERGSGGFGSTGINDVKT